MRRNRHAQKKSRQRGDADEPRGKARLLIPLSVLLILALVSFFIGTRFQSPRQAASKAAEPDASWITANVSYGILTERIVTRGSLVADGSLKINAPSSVSGTKVVTKLGPKVNSTAKEGDLLLAVSGRPILLCGGLLPVYRAMQPTDTGDDIKQLQSCLRRLGYDVAVNGTFDLATSIAVNQFYEKNGFQASRSTVTDSQIMQAKQSLDTATRGVEEAVAAQSDGIQLRQARRSVESATERKRTAQSDIEKKSADEQLTTAQESLTTLTSSLQQAVERASEQRATSEANYLELLSKWGPSIPVGEIVFAPKLPAVVQVTESTVGTVITGSSSSSGGSASLSPSGSLSSGGSFSLPSAIGGSSSNSGENPIIVLSSTKPLIKSSVPLDKAKFLRNGLAVGITIEATSQSVRGSVQLPDTPDSASGISSGQFIVVPDAEISGALLGASLRITLDSAKTKDKVLYVPVAAVNTGPNGTRRVTVLQSDNKTLVDVDVEVGITTGGNSEVKPAQDGSLREGDRVVIGK